VKRERKAADLEAQLRYLLALPVLGAVIDALLEKADQGCRHRLKKEPFSSIYGGPPFPNLIGGDAASTLYRPYR
jgi:hypothetical protein